MQMIRDRVFRYSFKVLGKNKKTSTMQQHSNIIAGIIAYRRNKSHIRKIFFNNYIILSSSGKFYGGSGR